MLTDFLDDDARGYGPYKNGRWCCEDGCLYRVLGLLHRATGKRRWLDHLTRLVDARIKPGSALLG